MQAKELAQCLEEIAPLAYQESYDNSGWIVQCKTEFSKALITLDCIESVVNEAIHIGADVIIAHHPIVFSGLKKLTGRNYVERTVMKAIQHQISIYAIHTNLDNVTTGVNAKIAELIGLKNTSILDPKVGLYSKIQTFVPESHAEIVRNALFAAGAGTIGEYENCSYNTQGTGTFKALNKANPFVGEIGKLHHESEIKIEAIFPKHILGNVIQALQEAHPYEEPAYDILPLQNSAKEIGSGMIGELPTEEDVTVFLQRIKQIFNCGTIKYTHSNKNKIKKVALCGGAGFFLLKNAIARNADIYITSDVKYHEFFDAEGRIILADIGHFESEQYTKELIAEIIQKEFTNFALQISEVNTNPVKYL